MVITNQAPELMFSPITDQAQTARDGITTQQKAITTPTLVKRDTRPI